MVVLAAAASVGGQGGVGAGEDGLRRSATNSPKPMYPQGALRRKVSGVAVVSVQSSAEGNVTTLNVLQAPDPEIGEAVRAAVEKWRFSPAQVLGRSELLGRRGKLTFYFRISNGVGVVLSPEELPEAERPLPQPSRPAASGNPPAGPPPTAPAVRTMTSGSHEGVPEIGEAEFNRLMAGSPKPFVLDPRERDEFGRDHRAGAVNLPYDEVTIRGRAELPRDRDIIIDCALGSAFPCQVAGSRLRSLGFTRVKVFIP
jgi:TonB family protein